MRFSEFGQTLGGAPGIARLMDDLGQAMSGVSDVLMLGGGNPGVVPEMREAFREEMSALLETPSAFDELLGNYDPPQGKPSFLEALAEYLNKQFGWGLSSKNICVTNGSQNASYFLFNMLAEGERKIILPLCPEYLGYADQNVGFKSFRPKIEKHGEHSFKYRVNFSELEVTKDDCAAIAFSRPTNPTGNVVTNEEVEELRALTKRLSVPLIVDNAYGAPFPNMIFSDIKPVWDENIILLLSLSKLGLPSTRTGIVVANEEVVQRLSRINAVCALSNVSLGQALITPLLASGKIDELCLKHLKPFYEAKAKFARELFFNEAGNKFPYYLHKTEGTMFLWAWFEDLPITSEELYKRLAKRGVIVVPGNYFFFGMDSDWDHSKQCIRINYGGGKKVTEEGFRIIIDEVSSVY